MPGIKLWSVTRKASAPVLSPPLHRKLYVSDSQSRAGLFSSCGSRRSNLVASTFTSWAISWTLHQDPELSVGTHPTPLLPC